jgi:SAM-dependent methyltransferase
MRGACIDPARPWTKLMALPDADERNAAQVEYWNGPGGKRWLDRHEAQDALLAPVTSILADRSAARAGETVIDVGCGCGTTSMALAQIVGPRGRVLGVDLSAPMLERARRLAPQALPVHFALSDATVFPFEPGAADLLFSRFGVMFFADPARSFLNMRRGLRAGARVVFACWREARANPWLLLPLQEAYRHVPRLPEVGPEDPGPFSFASELRVRRILAQAGFDHIRLEPIDVVLDLAQGRGIEAAVETALGIGPASRALDGHPPALRAAAAESVRSALARYQVGDRVPLSGAIWLVSASNP